MTEYRTRHEIEHRAPRKWLVGAITRLGESMTDANANAALHAISIWRNAMEDEATS